MPEPVRPFLPPPPTPKPQGFKPWREWFDRAKDAADQLGRFFRELTDQLWGWFNGTPQQFRPIEWERITGDIDLFTPPGSTVVVNSRSENRYNWTHCTNSTAGGGNSGGPATHTQTSVEAVEFKNLGIIERVSGCGSTAQVSGTAVGFNWVRRVSGVVSRPNVVLSGNWVGNPFANRNIEARDRNRRNLAIGCKPVAPLETRDTGPQFIVEQGHAAVALEVALHEKPRPQAGIVPVPAARLR
jgi:hypothetical protein